MAIDDDAQGMSDDDIYRHADRPGRYAHRVLSPMRAVSALLIFTGEAVGKVLARRTI